MSFWQRPDIIELIRTEVDFERLDRIRLERAGWNQSKHWGEKTNSLSQVADIRETIKDIEVFCDRDAVTIQAPKPLDLQQADCLESIAESLKPWRKGPFQLFDLEIDSEWRSNLKWDRIADALGPVKGKKVLDIGCGNGYYMFRASVDEPAMVLGLDPSVPFLLQFEMIQHFAQIESLQIELLGAEHLDLFHSAFDVVLCMGILYHQKNPVQILKDIWNTLAPGGTAIIESQIIPGKESIALFPEERYAKARNVFFVPTENCLKNWIHRAGFQEIETISVDQTTFDEQRTTRWSTFESLQDFLDPSDPTITVEGYPAPQRAAIRAVR